MCPECTSLEGKIFIFFIFKSGQGVVARRRHVTSCQLMRPKQGKAMYQRPLLYLYKIKLFSTIFIFVIQIKREDGAAGSQIKIKKSS